LYGARIVNVEVVHGEVEVDQRTIPLDPLPEHRSTLLVQLVVCKVEREQGGVLVEKLDELVHAPHVLAVHGQLVALQVEILERVVILEGLAELGGALGPELVSLQLQLP